MYNTNQGESKIYINLSCPLYNDLRKPNVVKSNDNYSNFNDFNDQKQFFIDYEQSVRNMRFVYINDYQSVIIFIEFPHVFRFGHNWFFLLPFR